MQRASARRRRTEGVTFLRDDGGQMRGVVNPLMTVVAACVARDLRRAVEQAQRLRRGDERERAAHVVRRNRVVVLIKAHVDGFVGTNRLHQLGVKGMLRQRQQTWLFVGESFRYTARVIARPGA